MGAQFSVAFVVEKLKTSNAFRGGAIAAAILLAFIVARLRKAIQLSGYNKRAVRTCWQCEHTSILCWRRLLLLPNGTVGSKLTFLSAHQDP